MGKTPLEDWIRKRHFPEDKSLKREKLDSYQLDAFRKVLEYAAQNSPFYKQRLSDVDIDAIRTFDDINNIPFTFPDDIRKQGSKMVCVDQKRISRIVTLESSGTTGEPKRIYFTGSDLELTIDFFMYGMSTFTKKNDRVLVLLPGIRQGSIGDLLKIGLSRMGSEAIVYGIVDDFVKVERIILDEKVNVIVGVPQQVLALSAMINARHIKRIGFLKAVLLSTDYVPDSLSRRMKKNWGCDVFEHYGMTETGLGGGVFCRALKGYHLREADLFFEIVDPNSGLPVKAGEYGEVVFTTLTREGMPLIRYRTGDISRFLTEPCACGTVLKTMDKIKYRIVSAIKLKNGLLTMSELDEIMFGIEGIVDFEVAVSIEGETEVLTLRTNVLSGTKDIEKEVINAFSRPEGGFVRKLGLKIKAETNYSAKPDAKGIRKRKIKDERMV